MNQSRLIDTIAKEAMLVDGIMGLYLGGSHGRKTADKFSDLDFVAVVAPDQLADVAAAWESLVGQLFDVVFCRKQLGRSGLINVITSDWVRIDLFLEEPLAFKNRSQDQLGCLFESMPMLAELENSSIPHEVSEDRLSHMANEFLRILGLVTIGVGRKEWFLCTIGLGHLRNLFMNFAIEAEKVNDGGALHLSRVVSPETLRILNALPVANGEREQIVAAHVETALAFFAYAKPIFSDRQLEWPEAFEMATRSHLAKELGCQL